MCCLSSFLLYRLESSSISWSKSREGFDFLEDTDNTEGVGGNRGEESTNNAKVGVGGWTSDTLRFLGGMVNCDVILMFYYLKEVNRSVANEIRSDVAFI